MSPAFRQLIPKAIAYDDGKASLEVHGVRITPPFLEFKIAIEGITYRQNLTIRNVGKSMVTVNIGNPTSVIFGIDKVKSRTLPSGLDLKKEVTCVCYSSSVAFSVIPIYINGHRIDYPISARQAISEILLEPKSIDFGLVDTNSISKTRVVNIRNLGYTMVRFFIESRSTSTYKITTDPNKGYVQAKSSVRIYVNMISNTPSMISDTLWVKCGGVHIIPVTAKVIRPMLEPICDSISSSFMVVEFPSTYIGAVSVQSIYVRNYSGSDTMFCIETECLSKEVPANCEQYSDQKYFAVSPQEGVWQSKEVKVFNFDFKPTNPGPGIPLKNFYLCGFRIHRLQCKYINPLTYEDGMFTESNNSDVMQQSQSSTTVANQLSGAEESVLLHSWKLTKNRELVVDYSTQSIDCLLLYLHAVAEKPSVTVTPDNIVVSDVRDGERVIRVLEFRNNSTKLPIIISYKKATFVEVEPPTIKIEANKVVQTTIFITPRRLGSINIKIEFELLHCGQYPQKNTNTVIGTINVELCVNVKGVKKLALPEINAGITPNYLKEVGKFCQDLRFNTKIKSKTGLLEKIAAKENSSTLIALPNDTQKSIRPWRGSKIKTIYTRIDRYVPPIDTDYELTGLDKNTKLKEVTYYKNYIREKAAKRQLLSSNGSDVQDYDLTVEKLICKDVRLTSQPRSVKLRSKLCRECIPLSPSEANRISIDPSVVITDKIATRSSYFFKLHIKNGNTHSIRIYLKPEKANLLFPEGNRKVINPYDETDLLIKYVTSTSGYYSTYLNVIVNECVVFFVNIIADVSPIMLNLDTNEIEIKDENIVFVEISNPMNTAINFRWSIQDACLEIKPSKGIIREYSKIACQVVYLTEEEGPSIIEAELLAFNSITQQLKVFVKRTGMNLKFMPKELEFKDMPLNIPVTHKVVLRNESTQIMRFSLIENELTKHAIVSPKKGTVTGKSYTVITITLKISCCVVFSTKLGFDVNNDNFIELPITGNVVYPNINIQPHEFNFKTITASTTSSIKFTVENKSEAVASVKFDLKWHHDFKVSESKSHWAMQSVEELKLNPHTSKSLYFHFLPTESSTDTFYFPIIINDILGPANNDDITNRTSYYMSDTFPDSIVLSLPEYIPVFKVHIYATAPKLKVSKDKIFLNYKSPPYPCQNEYTLKISNPQKVEDTFCIRTDHLDLPFSIVHVDGETITLHKRSIECCLPPQGKTVFNIAFKPEQIGLYNLALPIYLKSDKTSHAHNILRIEGVFEAPSISMVNNFDFYKPGPLLVTNTASIKFYFDHHLDNCRALVKCQQKDLKLSILMHPADSSNRKVVILGVWFTAEQSILEYSTATVQCSCGASVDVTVIACRENCFLTNYVQVYSFIQDSAYNLQLEEQPDKFQRTSSLVSVLDKKIEKPKEIYEMSSFFVEYPFFPEEDVELKKFMDECVSTIEYWVYTQGFFGRTYYQLPVGFSFVSFQLPATLPTFIQLLINLTSGELEKHFHLNKEFPSDDLERIRYLYTMYEQTLAFLTNLGAFFVYAGPELLLGYNFYCTYMENFALHDVNTAPFRQLSREDYIRLSKQTWLDVLLQTYKVLVLNRTFFGNNNIYTAPKKSAAHDRFTLSIKKIPRNKHLFNNSELLLMNWLEFHYNDVRKKLWMDYSYLDDREIQFYGENMTDGFVYAAVTIAYCPYLKEHFKDMYYDPLTPEEILHNNVIVVQSWRILNFSMSVLPEDIRNPHAMRTLFLMVYLYQMLPNLHPSETITLHADLSQHFQVAYSIKNTNSFPIAYKPILYGKYASCFRTDQEIYVVPPKMSIRIIIDYWAKLIKQTTCTLILSGECKGYHYAASIVVTLVGIPNMLYAMQEFAVTGNLYQVCENHVKFISPYREMATYRIQISYSPIANINEVNALPYRDNYPNNLLFRVLPMNNDVTVNSEGEGTLDFYILCLTPVERDCWIYFRNPDVGEFVFKLKTGCKVCIMQELLQVEVPANDTYQKPLRTVYLQIPRWNKFIWTAVAHLYSKLSGITTEFWKKYARTPIGTHILQSFPIKSAPPLTYNFCETTKFTLKSTKNCNVRCPKYIEIDNEGATDTIEIPLKIPSGPTLPEPFDLVLESENGMKFRSYHITFVNV